LAGSDLLEEMMSSDIVTGGGPSSSSSEIYGLLQGCGTPSVEHDHMLKRSARHAMSLLKFLVIDFVEEGDSSNSAGTGLNLFAQAFCSFPPEKYRYMSLDLHLIGDQRGGAQEDACEVMVLLLTQHFAEDGETMSPLMREDLLASGQAQQAFEVWVVQHTTKAQQKKIKANAVQRKEIVKQEQQAQLLSSTTTGGGGGTTVRSTDRDNDSDEEDSSDDDYTNGGDALAGMKRRKKAKKELLEAKQAGEYEESSGPALRWEDSQLYRERQARMLAHQRLSSRGSNGDDGDGDSGDTTSGIHDTVRDSQEAAAEFTEREEEKSQLLRKDPLGLHQGTDFDLRAMELEQVEHLEQALQELQEEVSKAEAAHDASGGGGGEEDQQQTMLRAKKESLEMVLDGIVGVGVGMTLSHANNNPTHQQNQSSRSSSRTSPKRSGGGGGDTTTTTTTSGTVIKNNNNSNTTATVDTGKSILPTESNFDPILFLTLVHRGASYEELVGSMNRLSTDTQNQMGQLQDMVRENFALFLRCADGIDTFNQKTLSQSGPGVVDRLNRLDALAESCAHQAKKSFKPLLDNANEVHKVQSALAVLQRVEGVLQAPYLMRQHIENGRFSQALKAYRRVQVIDDSNKIEILIHVKYQAMECAREARRELESRLAQDDTTMSVTSLLDAIRDLGELLELEIPHDPKEAEKVTKTVAFASAAEKVTKQHKQAFNFASALFATTAKGGLNKLSSKLLAPDYSGVGVTIIGGITINVRVFNPALACLLLQAAHFTSLVSKTIEEAETTIHRIYGGESLSSQNNKLEQVAAAAAVVENTNKGEGGGGDAKKEEDTTLQTSTPPSSQPPTRPKSSVSSSSSSSSSNQWKYDILEARSIGTIRAVKILSQWLPRLLGVAIAAREDERRRAARKRRTSNNRKEQQQQQQQSAQQTPFKVFLTNIAPVVTKLVEHATFCGLGSAPRGSGMEIKMTFGKKAPKSLSAILQTPLPPSQSSRVGKELAAMVAVLNKSSETVNELKPLPGESHITTGNGKSSSASMYTLSPLQESRTLAEKSVMTIERRRCIYAFDICARGCSSRATGSGKFDAEALLTYLRTLSEELTRPEECASEVEKGCEIVIRKCCDGLASYVRDRGDTARLSAVAECADVLQDRMTEVVREIGYLTSNHAAVEEVMMEDIMGLEGAMFDEFLDNIREAASLCCRIGWSDVPPTRTLTTTTSTKDDSNSNSNHNSSSSIMGFPPYLSASLLSIVRCRAQVEQALGTKVRKSEGRTYHYIAMATVAEGIAEGICAQIQKRKVTLKVRMSDRLANEVQFLLNTLKIYLSPEAVTLLDSTRRMLCAKAGRGTGGPDGLAALEDLERLGRVYVLCLGV